MILVDESDNAAQFNRLQICLSDSNRCDKDLRTLFLKMREEEPVELSTVALRLAKMSDPTKTDEDICYYLDGVDKDYFELGKSTAILKPKQKLDREEKSKYELILAATEHCHCIDSFKNSECVFFNKSQSNEDDISRLRIKLLLEDINDNSPKFAKKIYQIGITSDIEVGETILESFVIFLFYF